MFHCGFCNKKGTFRVFTGFCHLQTSETSGRYPVNITRELTKLRLSSHSLLIEKGRYFRPKIKRENRLCSQCNQIEDEQHFLIHCTKFANVRKLLFKKLNINLQDLCPSEYMKTITRLLNPNIIDDTEYMSLYQRLYEYQISLFFFSMIFCHLKM